MAKDLSEARLALFSSGRSSSRVVGRLMIGLNFLALAVLVVGALVLNESRRGLVEARLDSLNTQGAFIGNLIAKAATVGEPEPQLIAPRAAQTIQLLDSCPQNQRARLFDKDGRLHQRQLCHRRPDPAGKPLPPARKPGEQEMFHWPWDKPREAALEDMHARAVARPRQGGRTPPCAGSPVAELERLRRRRAPGGVGLHAHPAGAGRPRGADPRSR